MSLDFQVISKMVREKELPHKQVDGLGDGKGPTNSRRWSGLKNPRIVRVSRAFGGKDRHSKVSTVRGLRDRRVRLSVTTAIQLYELQDRLGLNQPSKVVHWLLNAAQHEIDKLPPLQLPPDNFIQLSQSMPTSTYNWNLDGSQRTKQRELATMEVGTEKRDNMKDNGVGYSDDIICVSQVQAHDIHRRVDHSSVFSPSNAMACTPYYQWDPLNSYTTNLGIHPSQIEASHTLIPSSMSSTPGCHLALCPFGVIPSIIPSFSAAMNDFDVKQ